MKKQQLIGALVLGLGATLAVPVAAEVSEECIFTGRVERSYNTPDTVRVNFTQIRNGDAARCHIKGRRGRLAQMEFQPQPGDSLADLKNGAMVSYRYQLSNGEHQWHRLGVDAMPIQVTSNN